jgi:hypothetical protein
VTGHHTIGVVLAVRGVGPATGGVWLAPTSGQRAPKHGEIGIAGTAAAMANAVFQATGPWIGPAPITIDQLL